MPLYTGWLQIWKSCVRIIGKISVATCSGFQIFLNQHLSPFLQIEWNSANLEIQKSMAQTSLLAYTLYKL